MPSEKVTMMILNVDLKCSCCYQKVKKILCKFPQIRDQVFDVEKDKVIIKVVCCNPEKIRDKLCCKGGKTIQSIEIIPNKPKPQPPVVVPVQTTKVDPPLKPDPSKKDPPKKHDPTPKVMPPVSGCCRECSKGLGGGPCHNGYWRPVPPPAGPCHVCCEYPYYRNGPCYVRCDYLCEENPQGCSIM